MRMPVRRTIAFAALVALPTVITAQGAGAAGGTGRGGGLGGPPVVMDSIRARRLYVSDRKGTSSRATMRRSKSKNVV